MARPTNFIIGVKSATMGAAIPKSILRVDFTDGTPLNSESYDDDLYDTESWQGAATGTGRVTCRDPKECFKLNLLTNSNFVVVGTNRNTGGADATHTFYNCTFAQVGGDIPGGHQAPEGTSINFKYGQLIIT